MYLPCSVQVNLVLCSKIDATEVRVVVIAGEETDKARCSERSCCLLEGLRPFQLLVSSSVVQSRKPPLLYLTDWT